MHVLTKIFIVLVSLLAVLLVPLVVVYAHNEDSWRAQALGHEANLLSMREELQNAQARFGATETRLQAQIEELSRQARDITAERDRMAADVQQLEGQLTTSQGFQGEINAQLATLSSALQAGQELTNSLVGEVRTLRSDVLVAERQKVDLDEALREVTSQLQVAIAARQALEEELQRLTEQNASLSDDVSRYTARFGSLSGRSVSDLEVPFDGDLQATVTSVSRDANQTLVEINAGSRDGLREGNVLLLSNQSGFVGNLRITNVDVNRAVGVLELANQTGRTVSVGDRAVSRPR